MDGNKTIIYGIAILGLGVGGYFFWKSQNKKKSDSESDVNDLISQALGTPVGGTSTLNQQNQTVPTPKPQSQVSTPTTITTTSSTQGTQVQQTGSVTLSPEAKLEMAKAILSKYISLGETEKLKCPLKADWTGNLYGPFGTPNYDKDCVNRAFRKYDPQVLMELLPFGFGLKGPFENGVTMLKPLT